jgi:hypothetical protein
MKRIAFLLFAVATLAVAAAFMPHASGQSDGDSSPIYGVKIPAGYRDWQLIAVKQLHFAGKGSSRQRYSGQGLQGRHPPLPGRRHHCRDSLDPRRVGRQQQGA